MLSTPEALYHKCLARTTCAHYALLQPGSAGTPPDTVTKINAAPLDPHNETDRVGWLVQAEDKEHLSAVNLDGLLLEVFRQYKGARCFQAPRLALQ